MPREEFYRMVALKKECSEKGAHLLNLWLAHYEAIRAIGDYILGTIGKEDAENTLIDITGELSNLEKQKLVSPTEYLDFYEIVEVARDNLENEKTLDVRDALNKIGKKAYNKMFDEVIACECGEALAIEEKLGKEALRKILKG